MQELPVERTALQLVLPANAMDSEVPPTPQATATRAAFPATPADLARWIQGQLENYQRDVRKIQKEELDRKMEQADEFMAELKGKKRKCEEMDNKLTRLQNLIANLQETHTKDIELLNRKVSQVHSQCAKTHAHLIEEDNQCLKRVRRIEGVPGLKFTD